jgi:hypothetical protein
LTANPAQATRIALRSLARRHRQLTEELTWTVPASVDTVFESRPIRRE